MWATTDSPGPGGIIEGNGLWPPPCLSQLTSNGLVFSGVAPGCILASVHTCVYIYERSHLEEAQLSPRVRQWKT